VLREPDVINTVDLHVPRARNVFRDVAPHLGPDDHGLRGALQYERRRRDSREEVTYVDGHGLAEVMRDSTG
jgi:hypothetical protein